MGWEGGGGGVGELLLRTLECVSDLSCWRVSWGQCCVYRLFLCFAVCHSLFHWLCCIQQALFFIRLRYFLSTLYQFATFCCMKWTCLSLFRYLRYTQKWTSSRDIRFDYKMGHLGPQWNKSGTFQIRFKYLLIYFKFNKCC